jgi:hypothetical protein
MDRFVWQPSIGMDPDALGRLRAHFKRPHEAMGEAWFMGGERRIFQELKGDLDKISAWDLQTPLAEIATGTSSFGPSAEWNVWYHYLLAQLLPRSHDAFVTPLLEHLITGFMAIYPNGVCAPPYRQFLDDALRTLGSCMMESYCWNGSEIVVGAFLHRSNDNPNRIWCWWDASGDFSASMFFCLKYLPPPLVSGWLHSVLAISSPHWRAQVLVWLVGSRDLLTGEINWPSELRGDARPSVDWEWSHCLRRELAGRDESGAPSMTSLLPEDSRSQVLHAVRSYFTDDVFLEWLTSISSVSYLEYELAEIPSTFESQYLSVD